MLDIKFEILKSGPCNRSKSFWRLWGLPFFFQLAAEMVKCYKVAEGWMSVQYALYIDTKILDKYCEILCLQGAIGGIQ